jgi:hypothetical protein
MVVAAGFATSRNPLFVAPFSQACTWLVTGITIYVFTTETLIFIATKFPGVGNPVPVTVASSHPPLAA